MHSNLTTLIRITYDDTIGGNARAGEDAAGIVKTWQAGETHWQQSRKRYLLYPE
jgi:hypothetical protein